MKAAMSACLIVLLAAASTAESEQSDAWHWHSGEWTDEMTDVVTRYAVAFAPAENQPSAKFEIQCKVRSVNRFDVTIKDGHHYARLENVQFRVDDGPVREYQTRTPMPYAYMMNSRELTEMVRNGTSLLRVRGKGGVMRFPLSGAREAIGAIADHCSGD